MAEEFLKALSLQSEPEASSLFSLVRGIGLTAYVHFLLSSIILKKWNDATSSSSQQRKTKGKDWE